MNEQRLTWRITAEDDASQVLRTLDSEYKQQEQRLEALMRQYKRFSGVVNINLKNAADANKFLAGTVTNNLEPAMADAAQTIDASGKTMDKMTVKGSGFSTSMQRAAEKTEQVTQAAKRAK